MNVEAVTVCIGYGDLLRETAPINRPLLSRWVVVTEPGDRLTRRVCRDASIECVLSDEKARDGAFSKGRLVNIGLAHLSAGAWLAHIDADIALPADFHAVLDDAHLSEDCIYGCDRLNVIGPGAWSRVKARGLFSRRDGWSIDPAPADCTIGSRVINPAHGYTPIGFFQLWHGSRRTTYPLHHGTAARTDVQHALHWSRQNRHLIPELLVWHLESERAKMGINWSGRKTAAFEAAGCYL